MLKYSVGLDVSAKDIHCCISVIDTAQRVTVRATRKISNNNKGFGELDDWVQRHRKQKDLPLAVCMEATGVYYEHCAMYLFKAGYTVSVILPNKAKKYLQASGAKSKNDRIDAKGLAQMGAEKSLDPWEPMGEFFYQLRELTRHEQSLQELKTAISNRLHASNRGMYLNKEVIKQLKAQLRLLEKQVATCEKLTVDHMEANAEVFAKANKICQMKGLGIKTVATLVAETNGFLLFKNARQLASFAGYDVVENQSGSHVGKTRISKQGNSHIRRILHMPALGVVQYNVKPFVYLYERTVAKHGIKMKGYVAVQKKLLTTIYALWKKNEDFDEGYKTKQHTEEQEPVLPLGSAALAAGATAPAVVKHVVPTSKLALHKVSMPSEQSPYASSRV